MRTVEVKINLNELTTDEQLETFSASLRLIAASLRRESAVKAEEAAPTTTIAGSGTASPEPAPVNSAPAAPPAQTPTSADLPDEVDIRAVISQKRQEGKIDLLRSLYERFGIKKVEHLMSKSEREVKAFYEQLVNL